MYQPPPGSPWPGQNDPGQNDPGQQGQTPPGGYGYGYGQPQPGQGYPGQYQQAPGQGGQYYPSGFSGNQGPLPGPGAPGQQRARNVILAIVGALVMLGAGVGIGLAAAHKSGGGHPLANPAPTVTVTVTPGQVPPAQGQGKVLLTFSGNGVRNSQPFLVNTQSVIAKYHFDCSGAGGSGNFIADMISGKPGSANSDYQSIANALSATGSQTTTLYPTAQGSYYHLQIDSECTWSITLTAG
ncbi:MAG: hypothetical protein ACR2FU_21780 [Streptosporangiaceae bacterium]